MSLPRVCVIILNYRAVKDTVECLESVMKLDYPDFQAVVVNNDPGDGSVEELKKWAEGTLSFDFSAHQAGLKFAMPPSPKPVSYACFTRAEAEKWPEEAKGKKIVFIESGRNGGYAFGNNIGMKYALACGDFEYVWILNNDTVAEPGSLKALAARQAELKKAGVKAAMTASKMLYYYDPSLLNGAGGKYYRWYGGGRLNGFFRKDTGQFDNDSIKFDYVPGAALFASVDFIKDAGYMCEDYFLFYEEMDWEMRARAKGWSHAYCHKSVIYHKEGLTISGSAKDKNSTAAKRVYGITNRLIFTKKFFPAYLPSVFVLFGAVLIFRKLRALLGKIKGAVKT